MSPLVEAAVALIRRRAKLAADEGDMEVVRLAAHLFAICVLLFKEERDAELLQKHAAPPAAAYSSLEELLEDLQELPTGLGTLTLYEKLVEALRLIEHWLQPIGRPALSLAIEPFTELETLRYRDRPDLGGFVYHWLRPARPKLLEKRDERYQLDPRKRPPGPAPHPLEQLTTLRMLWADGKLLGLRPVSIPSREIPLVRESGLDATDPKKGFRIALCPLGCKAHPRFQADSGGTSFTVHPGDPYWQPDLLDAHLREVLEAARSEEAPVHLVLFPELCIPEGTRDKLVQTPGARTPYGIVAGSFHVWSREEPDKAPFNESLLLDRKGESLLRHSKRGRYEVSGEFVRVNREYFPHPPERIQEKLLEGIRHGSELQILETSLGTLALLICADALEPDPNGYEALITQIRPDLLLLVAMSDETKQFEEFAVRMARSWIGTFFVNAGCICELALREGPDLVAFNLALYEPPGSAPTCVRWPQGADGPEYFSFQKPKGWRPLDAHPKPKSTGISWLGGRRELGLVVDLAASLATTFP